jgi:cold shock CspA family protein
LLLPISYLVNRTVEDEPDYGDSDVFVHASQIANAAGGDGLPKGATVEFELGIGKDGRPIAKAVTLV